MYVQYYHGNDSYLFIGCITKIYRGGARNGDKGGARIDVPLNNNKEYIIIWKPNTNRLIVYMPAY